MKARRILRVSAVAFGALAVACFVMQCGGRDINVELIRWDEPMPKVLELHGGKLWVSWRPRVPYRPTWAGQVNRYGFRYNVYSDGTWYAWAPLWALGAAFSAGALLTARASRSRRRRGQANLCTNCGYDLRAHVPGDHCPECGTVAPVAARRVELS